MATFRVISESNVRQLGPLSAGPVRPSGPCCLGVGGALASSNSSSRSSSSSFLGIQKDVREEKVAKIILLILFYGFQKLH